VRRNRCSARKGEAGRVRLRGIAVTLKKVKVAESRVPSCPPKSLRGGPFALFQGSSGCRRQCCSLPPSLAGLHAVNRLVLLWHRAVDVVPSGCHFSTFPQPQAALPVQLSPSTPAGYLAPEGIEEGLSQEKIGQCLRSTINLDKTVLTGLGPSRPNMGLGCGSLLYAVLKSCPLSVVEQRTRM
jgi:hypothetical protein